MKKLLLLGSLFLFACAKPVPVVVKVPMTVQGPTPDVYLMCSGKIFKGVLVTTKGPGNEVVYTCPPEANAK